MAYRLLHEYLVDGAVSSQKLTLSPHLVTRGNLEFFLKGNASIERESSTQQPQRPAATARSKSA
jgi:hypothetical protein